MFDAENRQLAIVEKLSHLRREAEVEPLTRLLRRPGLSVYIAASLRRLAARLDPVAEPESASPPA